MSGPGSVRGPGESTPLLGHADSNPPTSSTRLFISLTGIYLAGFTCAIDAVVLATLSTPIASTFGELPLLGWLAATFFVASAASQPVAGKLSDIWGRRSCLLVASIIFAFGNILCAFSPSVPALLAGRAVAGLGGGALLPLASIVISDRVPLRRRGVWQGIGNVGFAVGSGLGGPVGGLIHDVVGWRWAFLLQLPLTAVSMVLIAWHVSPQPTPSVSIQNAGGRASCSGITAATQAERAETDEESQSTDVNATTTALKSTSRFRRIDFLGIFLLISSLILMLLGLTVGGNLLPWRHPAIISALVAASISLTAFVLVELRYAIEPVLPVALLLRNRTVAAACLANWFLPMARFGLLFHAPLYFQAQGYTASATGLRLIPEACATAIASLGSGLVIRRTGRYWALSVGTQLLVPLGIGALAALSPLEAPAWPPFAFLFASGLGYSAMLTTTLVAMLASAGPSENMAGITSASYAFRSTGSVLGIAAASAVLRNLLRPRLRDLVGGDEAVVRQIESRLGAIFELPSPLREQVQRAYLDSLRTVFASLVGMAGAGVLASAFMQEHPLPTTLAGQAPRR